MCRYVFCPTYVSDAGRELSIELTSNTANYSGVTWYPDDGLCCDPCYFYS